MLTKNAETSPLKRRRQRDICMHLQQLMSMNKYTYSFSYKLRHDNDVLRFATDTPYSYSQLIQFLKGHAANPQLTPFLRINTLTHSLASKIS